MDPFGTLHHIKVNKNALHVLLNNSTTQGVKATLRENLENNYQTESECTPTGYFMSNLAFGLD